MAPRHVNKPRHHKQRETISDADSALFRASVGQVSATHRLGPAPRPALPSTQPKMREADEAEVMATLLEDSPADMDIETGDDLVYRQPGLQHSVIRRLRRGHYRCQAEIDLHGMVVAVARECLGVFLAEARERDYRCVRIVHGKGLRSGHRGPVLKQKVAAWLSRRADVLAYVSARPIDGGTGALYVLLQKAD